ncbi:MAG: hypothetical protein ACLPN1_02525 [Dissulfurispiraceae bacterium]
MLAIGHQLRVDTFGRSVALSGDGNTALVGAFHKQIGNNVYQGAAYVFTSSGTTWSQQQEMTASDGAETDLFGQSVALSGDGNTALIGAYFKTIGNNENQGAAYVFVRSGSTWSQQQELTSSDGAEIDLFGQSVALSGDGNTALIGADQKTISNNADQGAAYVFVRSGSTWSQQQELTASNGAEYDDFGFAVAFSGDASTALIGAICKTIGTNMCQGAAYGYVMQGLPTIMTATISNVTETTASGGGTITSDGGSAITAEGVCWSTSFYPTTSNVCTNDLSENENPFTSSITGLTPGQTYHVRSYVTNTAVTGYGADMTFFTLCGSPMITVEGSTTDSIPDGVNAATTPNSVVKANSYAFAFIGNVVLLNTVPVTLQGGYDCSLQNIVGYTEIYGQVVIQGTAAITISNIIIGPAAS